MHVCRLHSNGTHGKGISSLHDCDEEGRMRKASPGKLEVGMLQLQAYWNHSGRHNTLILGLRYSKILEYRPKINNTCQIRIPNTQCANLILKPALRNGLSRPMSLHSMPDPAPRGIEWSHVVMTHQEKHARRLSRGDPEVKCTLRPPSVYTLLRDHLAVAQVVLDHIC